MQGTALIGPTCPVFRIESPCPDRPWQGTVVAQDAAGREVTRTDTDADGRFFIALAPGDYVLVTLTTGVFPAPITMPVTIAAGRATDVQLMLDSGIR